MQLQEMIDSGQFTEEQLYEAQQQMVLSNLTPEQIEYLRQ